MKYRFIGLLLLVLLSCSKEQEPQLEKDVEMQDVNARLNHYWDLYENHKAVNPDSALHFMQEIKKVAEAEGKTKWVAASYGALGDVYRFKTDFGSSIFYYLKALKLSKELGQLKQLAKNYNNIALLYEALEDYEQAIFYAQQAKDIFYYEGNSFDKANIYRNLALYHSNLNQLKDAEKYIQLAEEVALKAQDKSMSSGISNTKGYLSFKQQHYEKAREYYHKAIELSDSSENGQWTKAAATNNIFEAYLYEKNYKEAEEWLDKTLAIKKDLNDPASFQITLNLFAGMLLEQDRNREAADLLLENFSRTDFVKTNPAVDEGLSLVQDALTKITAEGKSENAAYLSRKFATLNTYSKQYTAQAQLLREELMTLSQQLAVQANVDKYAQQEKAEEAANRNLKIMLIGVFLLLCLAAVMVRVMRKNRRYKALYDKVSDVLNNQALRQMTKR